MEAIELSNQLRSGNLINYMGKPIKCSTSTIFAVSKCIGDSFLYQPILLTDEFLIKLGFEQRKNYDCYGVIFDNIRFSYFLNKEWLKIDSMDVFRKIKYVHELQNIIHSLTLQELQYPS